MAGSVDERTSVQDFVWLYGYLLDRGAHYWRVQRLMLAASALLLILPTVLSLVILYWWSVGVFAWAALFATTVVLGFSARRAVAAHRTVRKLERLLIEIDDTVSAEPYDVTFDVLFGE